MRFIVDKYAPNPNLLAVNKIHNLIMISMACLTRVMVHEGLDMHQRLRGKFKFNLPAISKQGFQPFHLL